MTEPSYIGYWYATGPADRQFSPGDPAFSIHYVVSGTSDVPGCVTIQNPGGQRFPLSRTLLERLGPFPPSDMVNNPPGDQVGSEPSEP